MQRMPLVRGTLDVLVLRALNWGPMHGFEITTWLEDRSGGKLGVDATEKGPLDDVAQPWPEVRYIRILTVKSPSWIGWREIEVYPPEE